MSETTIQWTWYIDRFHAQTMDKASRGLRALTLDGAALFQNAMRESPRGGKWYGKHKASAAGEAPAQDTGRMTGATFGGEVENYGGMLVSRAVVNVEQAAALFMGTEKMSPRLSIGDVFNQNWDSRLMPIFAQFSK